MSRLIRRRRDERGAAAVLMGVGLLVIMLLVSAFAVDLGMQRTARRDMQALADLVALDLAREINGDTKIALKSTMDAEMARSLERNKDTVGSTPDLDWDLGKLVDGKFVSIANGEVPTAVKVSADTGVNFAFSGVTGVESGQATRSAVARNEESACFRLGSFIASLDTGQSALLNPILSALFGSSVNLNLVSYQGLAGANVSLLDLVELGGLGVGTVDELLALENVSVGQLFIAAATVLDRQGKLAEANLLRAIQIGAGTPTIDIGDLINASSTSAALDAKLNVLDLITSTAFIANGTNFVNIPNLGINLPGVASTTTRLTVIEPPQMGCHRVDEGVARTAQIKLDLTAHINGQTLSVGALGTSVTVQPIDLAISVNLGQAEAKLLSVHCNPSGPDSITVGLKSSVVGGVTVSATAGANARVNPAGGLLTSVLNLLGLGSLLQPPYLTLDAVIGLGANTSPAPSYNKTVVVPLPGGYTTPVGSGTGMLLGNVTATPSVSTDLTLHYFDGLLGLGSWKALKITDPLNSVFTGVLNPLVSTLLNSVLNPLVARLQTALVEPLTKLLGLQLGGADVYAVETPSCAGPKLVG